MRIRFLLLGTLTALVPPLLLASGCSSKATCGGGSCLGELADAGGISNDGATNAGDDASPGTDDASTGGSDTGPGDAGSTPGSDGGQPDAALPIEAGGSSSTFACNGGLACDVGSQVCRHVSGGPIVADAAIEDSCVAFPSSCTTTPTCACLETALNAQQCSQANGGFSVTVVVP